MTVEYSKIPCPKCGKFYPETWGGCRECVFNCLIDEISTYKKNDEYSFYMGYPNYYTSKKQAEENNMTEPKSIYDDGTIRWNGDNVPSDFIAKWNPQPTEYITMNGEPLSTKQLHELIVSQSMTIDAAMTRNGELVDALKRVRKLLKVGHYDQAMKILDTIVS